MDNLLKANVMATHDLRNLRVAETEKYAHVTYFFNGGIEKPLPVKERELVASQKVATYDLAPRNHVGEWYYDRDRAGRSQIRRSM